MNIVYGALAGALIGLVAYFIAELVTKKYLTKKLFLLKEEIKKIDQLIWKIFVNYQMILKELQLKAKEEFLIQSLENILDFDFNSKVQLVTWMIKQKKELLEVASLQSLAEYQNGLLTIFKQDLDKVVNNFLQYNKIALNYNQKIRSHPYSICVRNKTFHNAEIFVLNELAVK
ncbi:MAG: hypothetical protein LBV55_01360 [Acholeplasmatales bacterium]|jgi:gas vesicle protein|nr:hypothetical protein [Acholeplasmatales bacterium]